MVNCGELDMELGSKAKDKEEEEEEEEEEMIEKEKEKEEGARVDYRERGQWLRAAILGANDGLVSTASLMMGVDAVKRDMLVSGLAGLVGGACSMAIGEFVSVSSQRDAHLHHLQQQQRQRQRREEEEEEEENKDKDKSSIESRGVPNPMQAACASALSFAVGAAVPLVAASFVLHNNTLRLVLLVGVSSLALLIFGGTGAYLGRGPILKSCIRVLLAGWAAMLITYALLALFGHTTAL